MYTSICNIYLGVEWILHKYLIFTHTRSLSNWLFVIYFFVLCALMWSFLIVNTKNAGWFLLSHFQWTNPQIPILIFLFIKKPWYLQNYIYKCKWHLHNNTILTISTNLQRNTQSQSDSERKSICWFTGISNQFILDFYTCDRLINVYLIWMNYQLILLLLMTL